MSCTDTCVFPTAAAAWGHCSTCHQLFNSDAAFDKHRTGTFGVDRRCMNTTEMYEAGMSLNSKGRWVSEPWNADSRSPLRP